MAASSIKSVAAFQVLSYLVSVLAYGKIHALDGAHRLALKSLGLIVEVVGLQFALWLALQLAASPAFNRSALILAVRRTQAVIWTGLGDTFPLLVAEVPVRVYHLPAVVKTTAARATNLAVPLQENVKRRYRQ